MTSVLALAGIEFGIRQWMGSTFDGRFQYGYLPGDGVVVQGGVVSIVHTGGRKFWAQQFALAKPAGTLRLVTVGDSISRGGDLQESWPWQLGEQLRRQGLQVESINLSLPGFGSRRKLLLVQEALAFSPDLLIMQLGQSNEFEDERDWARARDFDGWHPRNWPMKSWLVRRLYEFKHENLFVKWLPADVRARTAVNDAADETLANQDPARVAAWRDSFARNTTEALTLARARGVPVLLVPRVVLRRQQVPPAFDDEGIRGTLAASLQGSESWFDTAVVFDPVADDAIFFRDGVHMHAPGHVRLAQALAQRIARMPAAEAAAAR